MQELGLDGAGEGVSVSSARASATTGHRRGSTALQVGQGVVLCQPVVALVCLLCLRVRFVSFELTGTPQMPHMKHSIPEFIDPKVRHFCCCFV